MTQPLEGWFEDFTEGMTFQTGSRTITETDINTFAQLSGDFNPIHVNADYAATTLFGQRIAHGLLVLSVASGLAVEAGFIGDKVEAFMSLEWEFRGPVLIGDTITVELEAKELRPMRRLGGGFVTFRVRVNKQDGSTSQRGEWKILFKSRPQ